MTTKNVLVGSQPYWERVDGVQTERVRTPQDAQHVASIVLADAETHLVEEMDTVLTDLANQGYEASLSRLPNETGTRDVIFRRVTDPSSMRANLPA